MIITSTILPADYKIKQHLGLLSDSEWFIFEHKMSGWGLLSEGYQKTKKSVTQARNQVLTHLEEQARNLGANAVIGVSFNYSTVGDVFVVSGMGTAVKYENPMGNDRDTVAENTGMELVNGATREIAIFSSNQVSTIIPEAIILTHISGNSYYVVLKINIVDDVNVGPLKGNIHLTNIFNEDIMIPSYFSGFQKATKNRLTSEQYVIEIPDSIIQYIERCDFIVNKYFCNDELLENSSMELHKIETPDDDTVNREELLDNFGACKDEIAMYAYLETLKDKIDSDTYTTLEKFLAPRKETARYFGSRVDLTLARLRKILIPE